VKQLRLSSRFLFYCLLLALLAQGFSQALVSSADELQPAVTPVPSYAPRLEVSVHSDRPALSPGETTALELVVTNHGPDAARDVQVFLGSQPDLRYLSGPNVPAEGSREVRFTIENLAVGERVAYTATARLDGLPGEALVLPAQVTTLGQRPTTTELTIGRSQPAAETLSPASEAALDGRLQWSQASDSEEAINLTARLLEWHTPENRRTGRILAFELTAGNRSGVGSESFSTPVELQLDLSGLVTAEEIASGQFGLFSQESGAENWQPVVATIEPGSTMATFSANKTGIIHVLENDPPASAWKPTYNPPGSSLFTGSATYNYPIALPPGIGGLQPSLSLNYGSRSLDTREAPIQGWLGWSIPVIEITNGGAANMYSPTGPGCPQGCGAYSPYEYNLVLNGASHRLVPKVGVSRHGEYTAIGDPTLRVVLVYDLTAPNRSGEYWRIQTADGTTYQLGYYDESELAIGPVGNAYNQNASQPRNIDFIAYSMKVDTITDVYGRQIRYFYDEQCGTVGNTVQCRDHYDNPTNDEAEKVEVAQALKRIEYNFNGTTPQTVVELTNNAINQWLLPTQQMLVSYFRTDQITVKQDGVEVAEYVLAYDIEVDVFQGGGGPMDFHHWWLTDITQYGKGGVGGLSLPAIHFEYNYPTYNAETSLLTDVDNGLGGHTTLDYGTVSSPAPQNDQYYLVDEIVSYDGVTYRWNPPNSTIPAGRTVTIYNSADACFDHENTPGCLVPGSFYASSALAGFGKVTVQQQAGSGTVLSQQRTTFNINNYHLNGQVEAVEQQDPGTGYTWSETVNTWQWWNSQQARLLQTDHYTYQPGQPTMTLHTKETFTYYEGSGDYGGLKEKREYDQTGALYRCTEHLYTHQTVAGGVWLVNHPLRQTLYPGDCETYANRQAETFYRYDGSVNMNDNDLNGKAELQWTLTWDGGSSYVTERRIYTAAGLLEKVLTYRDLSTSSTYASDVLSTIHITAYSLLGLPNTTQTSGSGFSTRTEYISYDSDFDWLPASTTDANGLTTTYDFDDFGRLVSVTKPLAAGPSMQYVYTLTSPPTLGTPAVRIETQVDSVAGGALETKSVEFYNGLGQVVQTSDLSRNVDTLVRDIVVQTDYDALRRPVCQSAPFASTANGGFVATPTCAGRDRTTTTYNVLGQTVEVRQPDGSRNFSSIDHWRQVATDAHFQPQVSRQDAFGRLLSRGEPVWGYEADQAPMGYTGTRITNDTSASESDSVLLAANSGQRVLGPMMDDLVAGRDYFAVFRVKVDARPNYSAFNLIVSDKNLSGGDLQERANRPVDGRAFLSTNRYHDFVVRFTAQANRQDWEFRVENPAGTNVWVDRVTVLPMTDYTYDIRDNLVEVKDAEGNLTQMSYNKLGQKTGMDDPDMGEWSYQYSQSGSLVRQTDAMSQQVRFVYDGLNRVIGKSLPLNNSTAYALYHYDTAQYGLGQPAEVNVYAPTLTDYFTTLNSGTWQTSGSVTINGAQEAQLATNASLTRIPYGLTAGQAVRFDFALSDVTAWAAELELASSGESNQWELAAHDNKLKARYRQNGGSYSTPVTLMPAKPNTVYTAVMAISDGGRLILHVWERDNPQFSASYSQVLSSTPAYRFRYVMTAGVGRLDNYQEMSWTTHDTFTYDNRGRSAGVTRLIDGYSFTMETVSYDLLDRPLTVEYPDGEQIIITYDREGENSLTAGSGTDTLVSQVYYNERSQMTVLDRGTSANSAVDTSYSYYPVAGSGNSNFRLQTIRHGTATDALPNFTYTYDSLGNIQSIAAYTNSGTPQTDTQEFDYDSLGRLTWARATGGVENYGPIDYSYDLLGNIRTTTEGGQTTTYHYDSNLYAHEQPHAVTSLTGGSNDGFSYDANGNMTSRADEMSSFFQEFDAENRLFRVITTANEVTSFTYDAAGQRVRTVLPNGDTTYYPFPNYEQEVRDAWSPVTINSSGPATNDAPGWNVSVPSQPTWTGSQTFPGTSLVNGSDHQLSNLATGTSTSPSFALQGGHSYQLMAYVKGELNANAANGSALIRVLGTTNQVVWTTTSLNAAGWQMVQGTFAISSNQNVQIEISLSQMNGWLAVDNLSLLDLTVDGDINVPDGSFESGTWTNTANAAYPATSLWRSNQGPGTPANQGNYSLMISNLAHTNLVSPAINVSGSTQTLKVWLRGEMDGAFSGGQVSVTLEYWDGSHPMGQANWPTWYVTTYNNTNWQQITINGTKPLGATQVKIRFSSAYTNGWMAFDTVTLTDGTSGGVPPTVPDSGFETGGIWQTTNQSAFPASIGWRGSGTGYTGTYAMTLTNGAYGTLSTSYITVSPNMSYTVSAIVRGEHNTLAGQNTARIRVETYNSSNVLQSTVNIWNGSDINSGGWSTQSGSFLTGGTVTKVKVLLQSEQANGWLAVDDVTLTSHSNPVTSGANQNYTLSALVTGVTSSPPGQRGGRMEVNYYNSSGSQIGYTTIWSGTNYNQPSGQTQSGSFTTPVNTATFRVSLESHLDNGWLIYDDTTLTGQSQTITASAGEWYRLEAVVGGQVQAALGQGGRILAKFNSGTPNHKVLWESPVNFNNVGTNVSSTFDVPSGATNFYIAYEVRLDNGRLSFNNIELERRTQAAATILRRSYGLAGQTIATRVSGDTTSANNGLFYRFADHLGSTSLLTNSSGTIQTNTVARYLPFGGFRTTPTQAITDQGYTGHQHNNLPDNNLGLIYMNARYYIPGIGRFASADTLIPEPRNSQSYNRYSYVYNNPLKYSDPTGHCAVIEISDDEGAAQYVPNMADDGDCWNEYYFLRDQLMAFGYDPDEYLGSGEAWELIGMNTDLSYIMDLYMSDAGADFRDGIGSWGTFLEGYIMYHIYMNDPDLAFQHMAMNPALRFLGRTTEEEPLSTQSASLYAEYFLRQHFQPFDDTQYIAAIDEANARGDTELVYALGMQWTLVVPENPSLPDVGKGTGRAMTEAFIEWADDAFSNLFN
jgi:RHS repeat-associated protein